MDMTNKWKSYFIQLLTFKQMHESMNWYVHDRMHVYVHFCGIYCNNTTIK